MLSYSYSSSCGIAVDWVPVGPCIYVYYDGPRPIKGTHRSINVRTDLQLVALHALPGTRRPRVILYLWQQPSKLTASAATARSCLPYQAARSMTRSLSYFTWNSLVLNWLKLFICFLLVGAEFDSDSRIYTDKLLTSHTDPTEMLQDHSPIELRPVHMLPLSPQPQIWFQTWWR